MTRINLKNLIVLLLPGLVSLGQAEVINNSAQRTILMVDDHHILYRAGTVRKLNPILIIRQKSSPRDSTQIHICEF